MIDSPAMLLDNVNAGYSHPPDNTQTYILKQMKYVL